MKIHRVSSCGVHSHTPPTKAKIYRSKTPPPENKDKFSNKPSDKIELLALILVRTSKIFTLACFGVIDVT